jgi:hypothetical protein
MRLLLPIGEKALLTVFERVVLAGYCTRCGVPYPSSTVAKGMMPWNPRKTWILGRPSAEWSGKYQMKLGA